MFTKLDLKTKVVNIIPLNEIIKVKRDRAITQGMMMFTGSVGSANVLKIETESQEYSLEFRVTDFHRTAPEIVNDLDLFGRLITERIPKRQKEHSVSADEIRKLDELKNEGIITQDEFDFKKKQLLGI